MTTRNRSRTVLTLAAVAMAFLVLPAGAIEIPDVLPDPDTTPPDSTKPVKVFILSGQSNMVGFGRIAGTEAGTLKTITDDGMVPHLVDDGGAWTVRNDGKYRGVVSAIGNGFLTPGFGANSSHFGPELGFGHVMGYYYDEPVIVLKTSIGNRSLSWDCLPPGSTRFIDGDYTYAGYGDYLDRWLTAGGEPKPFVWYAGKQYDDYFLDESDMGPMAWTVDTHYQYPIKGDMRIQVRNNGVTYISEPVDHTSSPASEPGVGAEWTTYWSVYSFFNVVDILDNFGSEYPEYAAQGFEIAGYGWWQGHKDGGEQGTGTAGVAAQHYEENLANLIDSLRDYYEDRYPANTKTDAPFVVATVGFSGGNWEETSSAKTIWNAQMAVGDPGDHPEYTGNVASVDTTGYWRDGSVSPTSTGYHYNHNAETFMLAGDAMGRAMADLLQAYSVDAGDDMITWSGEPVELDATIEEGVTVVSYAWSAVPDAGVVFDPNEFVEDPTVTITKATANPSTVKLTLAVDDGINPPERDIMTIDVYDTACKAAIGKGLAAENPTDLDANCITDVKDLATLLAEWLNDTGLTAPEPK